MLPVSQYKTDAAAAGPRALRGCLAVPATVRRGQSPVVLLARCSPPAACWSECGAAAGEGTAVPASQSSSAASDGGAPAARQQRQASEVVHAAHRTLQLPRTAVGSASAHYPLTTPICRRLCSWRTTQTARCLQQLIHNQLLVIKISSGRN